MNQRIRQALDALRVQEAKALESASRVKRARVAVAKAMQLGNRTILASAQRELKINSEQVAELRKDIDQQRFDLDRLRDALIKGDAGSEIDTLAGKFPVVLLPVRLETRFMEEALVIRIFPDDIHVDQHDERLSDDEVAIARSILKEDSIEKEAVRRRVFDALSSAFSAPRAAWILRRLREAPNIMPQNAGSDSDRVPRAAALPDRFIAIGIRDARQVFVKAGRLIPEHVPLGPDPMAQDDEVMEIKPDDALSDPGLVWLHDLKEAEARGLAIRVSYADSDGLDTKGVDELFVVGIRSGLDADEGIELLESLFAAHRYGAGLGFVEQGTPSNNTSTAVSGFEADLVDVDAETAAVDDVRFRVVDGSNDEHFADAIGIRSPVARRELLARIENANLHEQGDARAMNAALWSISGGYFIEQLLRPLGGSFSKSDLERIELIRKHFISHVRGRGSVPVFRIAEQPYGVLPVILQSEWKPFDNDERDFDRQGIDLLKKLRRFWTRASVRVPRVATGDDPQESLFRVLGLQAVSDEFRVHALLGPTFLKNIVLQHGPTDHRTRLLSQVFASTRSALRRLLRQLGLSLSDPLLSECVHALCDYSISDDVTQTSIDDNVAPLEPHYISWLLNSSLEQIENETGEGAIDTDRGVPLLYLLLRHAALLELADAARIRITALDPTIIGIREPELIDIVRARSNLSGRSLFSKPIANALDALKLQIGGNGSLSIGQQILDEIQVSDVNLQLPKRLVGFWNSLRILSKLSAENLDELTRETLDLFSSRYDAWASSFASKRLEQIDKETGGGRWVGAWGYVEDLRPRRDRSSEGYMHAPSLNQAATAAVLYNGYLTHVDSANDSPLAIELDSARVRDADALVDGLRQGVSLSSLLGYRFERHLQESQLQVHSLGFRRGFPGVDSLHDANGELDSDAESLPEQARVLDGLALVRAFSDGGYASVRSRIAAAIPSAVPPARGSAANRLQQGMRTLQSALDALSDALTVESVHQLMLGNTERAGAALEAMSGSGSPPPELQAMKTPRTGVPITHRVLATWAPFDGSVRPTLRPVTFDSSELRQLLPGVDDWASHWLQASQRLRFPVTRNGVLVAAGVSLDELGLSALDLLFTTANADVDRVWLKARVLQHFGEAPQQLGVPDNRQVQFSRMSGEDFDVLLFEDVEPIIVELRNLLGSGRMLDGRDLIGSGDVPIAPLWDASDFITRLDAAVTRLTKAAKQLNTARQKLIASPQDASRQQALIKALWALLPFCIAEAITAATEQAIALTDSATREQLLEQAEQVLGIADQRIAVHREAKLVNLPRVIGAAQRDELLAAVTGIFGVRLPVVLPMALSPTEAEAIEAAWVAGRSDELQAGDSSAADRWLSDLAGVRDRLGHWHELRLRYGITHLEANLPLTVAQLPINEDQTWIALPQATLAGEFPTSLVAHSLSPIELLERNGLEGWLIDEWQDLIPQAQETTGLAFHYDSPGSHAPNAVLIAVAADVGANWSLDSLIATVREATELMRHRGVAGQQLDGLGHLLPAITIPHNSEGATVSTDLRRAQRAPDP